jgi:hypothetical protein
MAKTFSPKIKRRSVIKIAGMVASSLAIAPFIQTRPSAAQQPLPARNIGILAFQSTIQPTAAQRWIAGVQSGLGQAGISDAAHYFVDYYDGRPSNAADRALALMESTSLHALVVLIDAYTSSELRRICVAHNLPLVMSSLGANVTRPFTEDSTSAYQSLNYWQSSTAVGAWAANTLGKRAVAASSFYESGYDLPFAFRVGYESAGGVIESTHVSHLPTSDKGISSLMNTIQAVAPDVVYASYCGQDAVDFVHAYVDAGLNKRIPLITSSFMVDDVPLQSLGSDALGIYNCASWPSEPFALLGQQAAQRATTLLNSSGTAQRYSRVAYIPLFQTGTPSPTPDTPKFYVRQVQSTSSGIQNVVIDTLSADGSNDTVTAPIAEVNAQLQASIKTGWISEYLS